MLLGGTIPPAPAVPPSTRISSRLKRAQEHSSRVHTQAYMEGADYMAAGPRVWAAVVFNSIPGRGDPGDPSDALGWCIYGVAYVVWC